MHAETARKCRYPGGKGGVGVYQTIINCIPPHETYIEAFLGGGAVLRNKRPAKRNIGIDLDEDVVRDWRSASSPLLDIIHGDALNVLHNWQWDTHDQHQTLIYCDPPYLSYVRQSIRPIYKHDFGSDDQHRKLLQLLIRLPCMVMLSGYRSPLYHSVLGQWRQLDFRTVNRAGRSTIETIWMNFPAPLALHDYRYLGNGFRERERIRRKRLRWKARLSRMSELERKAVLWALHDSSHNIEASQPSPKSHLE